MPAGMVVDMAVAVAVAVVVNKGAVADMVVVAVADRAVVADRTAVANTLVDTVADNCLALVWVGFVKVQSVPCLEVVRK